MGVREQGKDRCGSKGTGPGYRMNLRVTKECQDSSLLQCLCHCRLNYEGNIGRVKGKHREGEGET